MSDRTNTDVISQTFEPIYDQPCWGLHFSHQLNLLMNFGKPSLRIRDPIRDPGSTSPKSERVRRLLARRLVTIRGEWWLWLQCCHWRLSSKGKQIGTSSASLLRIRQATAELDGQKLTSVDVEPATGATRFAFDLGCVLDCRRFEKDSDSALWYLYKPSGYVLSVHGNGTFSHQRGSAVKENLIPLDRKGNASHSRSRGKSL
jgi:hypothetical protein